MEFHFWPSLVTLPDEVDAFWRDAAAESFFLSRWWFETVLAWGIDATGELALGLLRDRNRRPLALLPCHFAHRGGAFAERRLESLTGIYACLFRPLIAPDADQPAVAQALGREVSRQLAASDILNFDAMDGDWPGLASFERGLSEAGFIPMRYDHFGSWSEDLDGRSFADYLQARDPALREILRRKTRAAERLDMSLSIVAGAQEMESAIAAYGQVYERSWKHREPYPDFIPSLMRNAALHGALRLGFCHIAGQPAAVQLWIIWNGRATVLKLAHDEAFQKLSLGSLLTAHMIRQLMERDGIRDIDFGRGDDPYKQLWAGRRRQRIGLLAANPHSPAGMALIARQKVSELLRPLRRLLRLR